MKHGWLVGVGLVLSACASEPAPPPVLGRVATLNVTLNGDGSLDPTQIRLAIVWDRSTKFWPQRLLEPQELVVASHTLSWPVTFELALTEPPPYDAYWSSPSVGLRAGTVVAFLDDNHNGKLDFTPINASAFTDRIVGFNPIVRYVFYPTFGTFAFNSDYSTDLDVATPVTLFEHDEPVDSCNLLEDWVPYRAYRATFGASDPNDPQNGPRYR